MGTPRLHTDRGTLGSIYGSCGPRVPTYRHHGSFPSSASIFASAASTLCGRRMGCLLPHRGSTALGRDGCCRHSGCTEHPRAPDLSREYACCRGPQHVVQIAQFALTGCSVLLVAAQSSAGVRASRRDVFPTIVVRLLIVADMPLSRKEHAITRFPHVHAPRTDVVFQATGDGIGDVHVVPDAVLGRHQAGHDDARDGQQCGDGQKARLKVTLSSRNSSSTGVLALYSLLGSTEHAVAGRS